MKLLARPAQRGEVEPGLGDSFGDLASDFEELAHIAGSMSSLLSRTGRELLLARQHLHGDSLDLLEEQLRWFRAKYDRFRRELMQLRGDAARGPRSVPLLAGLTDEKHAYATRLRTLQGTAATLVTASEWQSPSFGHSVHSAAGCQTGKVTEHVDDYRRDRHPDAAAFEEAYLDEYIDDPYGVGLRALMTSCGMSAFSTILSFLIMDRGLSGTAIVGRSLYHECKDLIAKSRPALRMEEVPETRTEAILRSLEQHRPVVVFLDSLCNAKGVEVPDLPAVIGHLARQEAEVYVVIDNTGLSCMFQPFGMLPPPPRNLHLISFESLTKFAQLGLDRTPAGMIVAPAVDARALDPCREHLGTNVSDCAAHMVPQPNRRILERRLSRLGRNALLLASRVQEHAEQHAGVIEGAAYPGLAHHPSFEWARRSPFCGGFFSIEFRPAFDATPIHHRFVELALEEARRRWVPLAVGASFGLDTTRIYLTAATAHHARPFVRVAAGTEHRLQVEALGEVLSAAMVRLTDELGQSRSNRGRAC